jgi:cupredoxin-like protein
MTGGQHTQHWAVVMRRLAPALLVLVLLTGCERDTTELDTHVVELRVRDFRYDRQNVSVPSGRIVFGVANDGPQPTNFRIRNQRRDLLDIPTMQPGERGSASVHLRPGEYVMYSSVGRHETLGEHGKLVVRPG